MTSTYHYQSDHRQAKLLVSETETDITFTVECSSRGKRPDDAPLLAWLKATMMEHVRKNEDRKMHIKLGDDMEVILK